MSTLNSYFETIIWYEYCQGDIWKDFPLFFFTTLIPKKEFSNPWIHYPEEVIFQPIDSLSQRRDFPTYGFSIPKKGFSNLFIHYPKEGIFQPMDSLSQRRHFPTYGFTIPKKGFSNLWIHYPKL
ncbi:hypothetical protein CEXT_656861 [Caerostris extrusa]|uniref:Uncharacterized protein n=1 Tax=Caerostris extrusa TaxID=172846 RepID=A0AAV4M4N4_CAEEX|nr:hypothetical protein CEXT_656861 [Caerostris extrusa]